ncbi:MAG: hypothetical protein J6U77_00630, partial [Verrucomicrobia bacterium]|nr:hypothetical protein [Verrucomicrobiota bacterium]
QAESAENQKLFLHKLFFFLIYFVRFPCLTGCPQDIKKKKKKMQAKNLIFSFLLKSLFPDSIKWSRAVLFSVSGLLSCFRSVMTLSSLPYVVETNKISLDVSGCYGKPDTRKCSDRRG